MRKRLYEIIEVADAKDRLSHFYDLFMMACIVTSLIPLCTKSTETWKAIIDEITVTVFIVDYILRFITADLKYPTKGKKAFILYPFGGMAIIDLLAILPSFGVIGSGIRILKVFRLFRTLKVLKALKALKAFKALKIFRYSRSIQIIIDVIRTQKEALITVGGLAVGYIFVAALVIFNVEPDSFGKFFDAIYWACVSLSTVGYGDIYPVTTAGRIVTMVSSIVGIAVVALPSGIITAGYLDALNADKTRSDDSEEEHQ